MAVSTTGGQNRPEVCTDTVSYSLGRWLGEGPGEGYWNSQTRGS